MTASAAPLPSTPSCQLPAVHALQFCPRTSTNEHASDSTCGNVIGGVRSGEVQTGTCCSMLCHCSAVQHGNDTRKPVRCKATQVHTMKHWPSTLPSQPPPCDCPNQRVEAGCNKQICQQVWPSTRRFGSLYTLDKLTMRSRKRLAGSVTTRNARRSVHLAPRMPCRGLCAHYSHDLSSLYLPRLAQAAERVPSSQATPTSPASINKHELRTDGCGQSIPHTLCVWYAQRTCGDVSGRIAPTTPSHNRCRLLGCHRLGSSTLSWALNCTRTLSMLLLSPLSDASRCSSEAS